MGQTPEEASRQWLESVNTGKFQEFQLAYQVAPHVEFRVGKSTMFLDSLRKLREFWSHCPGLEYELTREQYAGMHYFEQEAKWKAGMVTGRVKEALTFSRSAQVEIEDRIRGRWVFASQVFEVSDPPQSACFARTAKELWTALGSSDGIQE